ncbi:MAG: FG-GAP repeat domain-containing protein [Pyrinomonadaceae bacterium]
MKVRNAEPERLDILGKPQALRTPVLDAAAVRSWRKQIGYFSLFAGLATIVTSQAGNAIAGENDKAIPPRVKRQAAELVQKLKSGACSKPELLRRQSEYRLPGQRSQFNMVEILAGADNCPGAPIPSGNYTTGAPFTDTGSTVGANSTVDFPRVGCSNYDQTAGPDHIYSFRMSARGANPQIRVAPGNGLYDTSIYILNGATGEMCPVTPGTQANPIQNCLVGSDSVFAGGQEIITAAEMNSLPLNTPLLLFVDSFYDASQGTLAAGPYTLTIQDVTITPPVVPPANDAPVDINGDGKTDFVTIRNVGGGSSGQVRWFTSFQDGFPTSTTDWGIASDFFVPADYDGDGRDDFAVWRPGSPGVFYIVMSATQTLFTETFGQTGDDPTVVGDYTGDNIDDLAVYRAGATPADQSTWYYRSITAPPGIQSVQWGKGGDVPAPGDYDGDKRNDFVVQRIDSNGFSGRFWKRMATGEQSSEHFGLWTDSVVPGDYDDDGRTDIAVVRDDNGTLRWEFEPSGTAGSTVVSDTWGVTATDWIVQGDYDGDGRTDYAIWRPGSPGLFYIMTVGDRVISIRPWGETGDAPVANYNEHF